MPHQQRVAGAGRVVVVGRVVIDQAVVGAVVDPAERQRRALVVALGGVVVDHVEDDLDAGLVQRLDHPLELRDLLAPGAVRRILVVRGEEADRVVAPVVPQPLVEQGEVLDELVDRHELDGGDAQLGEVLDRGGVTDAGVGAADVLGHVFEQLGQALDVGLVDDRVVVLVLGLAVLAPVEERVDDDRRQRLAQAVLGVGDVVEAALRVVHVVAEQRRVAAHLTVDRLGVGVEEQLGRVAAGALRRLVGAVYAVAVALPRLHAGEEPVPDEAVDLREGDAGLLAALTDEAQLDALRHLGEDREVHARPVVGRAERVRLAGPDLHECLSVGLRPVAPQIRPTSLASRTHPRQRGRSWLRDRDDVCPPG